MSKLEEIVSDYRCYDIHAEECDGSCQRCENLLRKDLIELIAKVRADAIEEVINKLKIELHPCLNCSNYSSDKCNAEDIVQDFCIGVNAITFKDVINFAEQLKEKKE